MYDDVWLCAKKHQKTMAPPMHKLCCEGSQCLMKIDYVDVAVSWQNPRVAPSSWKVSITSRWVGKSPTFHITQQKRECRLCWRWVSSDVQSPQKHGPFTNPTNYQPNFMAENPPSGHIPQPCGAIIGRRCQEPLAILGSAPALKPSRPTSCFHVSGIRKWRIPRKQISWEKWYGF